jgi:hypothetical protein
MYNQNNLFFQKFRHKYYRNYLKRSEILNEE